MDFLNSNRTEQYYQDTVGLMFKYLPVAIELEDVSSIDKLLSEVNRQVAESFVHSICDYNPEGEVAMRDALAVNYVADMGDVSLLEGFMATEIPLSSEKRAAGCHADVYLMESDGELEICVEYQKEAYKPGSLERFLDIFAGHLKALTGTEQKV